MFKSQFKNAACLFVISLLFAVIGLTNISPTFAHSTVSPKGNITQPVDEVGVPTDQMITTLKDLLPVLQELEAINLSFHRQPGWVHTITEDYSAFIGEHDGKATAGMFDHWEIIDSWTGVLDDGGTLGLGSYTITSTRDGRRLQVVAGDGFGHGGNLTLLQRGLQDAFGTPEDEGAQAWQASLPTVITSQMTDYIKKLIASEKNLHELASWTETEGDQAVLRISRQTRYAQAIKFDEYPQPVVGFNYEDTISLKTGDFILRKAFLVYEDDSEILYFSRELKLSEAGVSMPQETMKSFQADIDAAEELKRSFQTKTMAPNTDYFSYQ